MAKTMGNSITAVYVLCQMQIDKQIQPVECKIGNKPLLPRKGAYNGGKSLKRPHLWRPSSLCLAFIFSRLYSFPLPIRPVAGKEDEPF